MFGNNEPRWARDIPSKRDLKTILPSSDKARDRSFNPNYSHYEFEPSALQMQIPYGAVPARMKQETLIISATPERPWNRRWRRYYHERELRVPKHMRRGLPIEVWEAKPPVPNLVPTRDDFYTDQDFVDAKHDFLLHLYASQLRADKFRRVRHPGVHRTIPLDLDNPIYHTIYTWTQSPKNSLP